MHEAAGEQAIPSSGFSPEPFEVITRTGLKIAGLATGDAHDPPVLMLHGWLDNAASFGGVMPLLPGRRLLAIDLPGHGESDHLPSPSGRHFIDWITHVEDVVDALGLETFELVGHSMGAAISMLYAGTRPERITRLVLIEGLGPLTDDPAKSPQQARRALIGRARAMGRAPRRLESIEEAIERMLAARMPMSAHGARVIAERNTRAIEGGLEFSYDPLLQTTSLLRLTEPHLLAFMAEITAPTLLVRASEGWPVSDEVASARLAAFPSIEVAEVSGGHHAHLDEPEETAAHVRRFLGLVPPKNTLLFETK